MRPIGYVVMERKGGKLLSYRTGNPMLFTDHDKAIKARLLRYGGRSKNGGQRLNNAVNKAEVRICYIQ